MQATTFVTGDYKESMAGVLCLTRQIEWISRVEQCGLLGTPCHTSGSLQGVLSSLRICRVFRVV